MFRRLFKGLTKQKVALEDTPFEPITTTQREGIFDIETVEERIGGGRLLGKYRFVKTEKAKGEVLEISDKDMPYHLNQRVRGIILKIQCNEGHTGEVSLPIDISRLERRDILNQRVEYEHKSDRFIVGLYDDTVNHRYSLKVLTGQLSGETYSSEGSEVR